MGFGAEVKSKNDKKIGEVFIKAFTRGFAEIRFNSRVCGQTSRCGCLDSLDEDARCAYIDRAENHSVKQYKKLFEYEGCFDFELRTSGRGV